VNLIIIFLLLPFTYFFVLERSRAFEGSGENEWVATASRRSSQQVADEVPSLATVAKVDFEPAPATADGECGVRQELPPVSKQSFVPNNVSLRYLCKSLERNAIKVWNSL